MINIRIILLILFVGSSNLGFGQQPLYAPKGDSIKTIFQEFLQEIINSKVDPSVSLDANTRFEIVFKAHCGNYDFPEGLYKGKIDSLLHKPPPRFKAVKLTSQKLLFVLKQRHCSNTRITTWHSVVSYKELMRKNKLIVYGSDLLLAYNINNKYLILYEKNSIPLSRSGDVGYYTASFAKIIK